MEAAHATSFVIVTHNSRDAVGATIAALVEQMRDGDEVIVVDNASQDGTPAAVRDLAPGAKVIETGGNPGFAAACNRGAREASGELLVLLNPDATPQPGFRDAIERPHAERRGWAAWQGLVTSDGGRVLNARGGALHFTGIAWAAGAGEPLAAADARDEPEPAFVSGACLAIPRTTYVDEGGLAEEYFLYHEDVDLSLRLRLGGGRLGVVPEARVDHEYEFEKGPAKWRHLERNRWATVIRTYPPALLVLLAPALLATELALIPVALTGGWLRQKLLAWGDTLRALPRLLRERRGVQARRIVSAGRFAEPLTADLDSLYLGAAGRSCVLRALLRAYWSLVCAVLGAGSGSPG